MAIKKILVMDDNEEVRVALKALLISNLNGGSYVVFTAKNADEGLQIAKTQLPDLIISDIVMPGKDGVEAYRFLKADPRTKGIPVIFLTSLKTRQEERQFGVDDHEKLIFAKPVDAPALLKKIRELMRVSSP